MTLEVTNPHDFRDLWWVSNGKDGKLPPKRRRLIDLEASHLMAIFKNCRHIRGTQYELAIRTMLEM